MSPDPLWVKADRLLLPQRLNLYAYGTNNPLRFTDPTGMDVNIGYCAGTMTTSMCEAAIKNGVPKGDRDHIHFVEGDGKNGYAKGQTGVLVDADYKSSDTNFQTLQTALCQRRAESLSLSRLSISTRSESSFSNFGSPPAAPLAARMLPARSITTTCGMFRVSFPDRAK